MSFFKTVHFIFFVYGKVLFFVNLLIVASKRGKVVSYLRTFLSSRPSRVRLLQSGILRLADIILFHFKNPCTIHAFV